MTNENKAIEQLWYTWPDVGIITAGFHIRAASAGLQDFRSDLIRRLDLYQRYSLPGDADRSIDPKIAPVCLALIDTGKERILVHKVYTGKDGVGRYGAFFIHLLVLPEDFPVTDAISLWKSPFWQNSDVTLKDRRSTYLERVPLVELRQQQKKRAIDRQTIEKYLPYVFQAYLTKNLKTTTPQAPQKLYIAGPDDVVAQLISGLIHCLPAQLVKDLTFSTYEPDVNEAKTEIVGTCWLSVPKSEKVPTVARLLPPHYYQQKLALNCYTGEYSPLVNHHLAAQCAQAAVEYFLTGTGEFQELLDEVASDDYLDLTVERLLQLFETIVVNAQKPVSRSDIEDALMAHALSGYNFSARMLSRKDAQSTFFSLILNVPGWWATYKNALINLRRQSTRVPKLAQALTKIAREALPLAIDMVKNEKNSILVDMMRCAAPPQEEPSVWYDLLYKMPKTKQTLDFLQNHWSIHTELMKAWAIAVPPSITPLLTTSWAKFGEFLNLDLPFDWVEIATEALVFRAKELGFPPPDQERVHYLEQKYHQNIQKLLEQLSQNPQRSLIVTALFDTLVTNGYQKKMALLLILLDSPMGNDENTAKGLLRIVQLAPDEKALFLANYGPRYLPNKQFTVVLLDLFTELASSDLQKEKMRVLFSWLDSPHLSPWLNPPQKGGENLATVLIRASLNTNQIGEFFQRYGQKYIPLYPQSSILLSLLDSYASSRGRLRLSLLNTWFKCNLSEETLTRILGNTHLTSGEKVSFLQHYGKHYLSLYPHWGLLKDYAQEFLNYLRTTNITIFKGDPTPEKPSSTEEFLSFLSTSSLPHVQLTLIYHWYNVAQFVGQPSLLRKEKEGEPIAQSIKYLLVNTLEVQSPMRTGLIRELAGACIANENEVKRMIDRIHSILVLPDRVQLLHNIAESVRDGIYQKKYAKTLYVSCIQSALGFKQAEQESFVNNFLNTLLQNVDERTLKWLDKEATHWPANISTSWRRYRSQRSSSSTTGKSLLQRIKPFLDT